MISLSLSLTIVEPSLSSKLPQVKRKWRPLLPPPFPISTPTVHEESEYPIHYSSIPLCFPVFFLFCFVFSCSSFLLVENIHLVNTSIAYKIEFRHHIFLDTFPKYPTNASCSFSQSVSFSPSFCPSLFLCLSIPSSITVSSTYKSLKIHTMSHLCLCSSSAWL